MKICVECGEKFKRGEFESGAVFRKRIYCSNKCVQVYLNRRHFLKKHPEEKDMTP